jgi:hypothetical protein
MAPEKRRVAPLRNVKSDNTPMTRCFVRVVKPIDDTCRSVPQLSRAYGIFTEVAKVSFYSDEIPPFLTRNNPTVKASSTPARANSTPLCV